MPNDEQTLRPILTEADVAGLIKSAKADSIHNLNEEQLQGLTDALIARLEFAIGREKTNVLINEIAEIARETINEFAGHAAVIISMDRRTASLVQTCIEEHRAKATQWTDEDIDRTGAVIVDLERQLEN